jgi:hypothetical protein
MLSYLQIKMECENRSHSSQFGDTRLEDQKAKTINHVEVRLLKIILERIRRKHRELRGMESLILETISAPDLILQGHERELLALKHYDQTPLGRKDMVVVYREDKQLVITAFLTSDHSKLLRRRRTVWLRLNS